MAFQYTKPPWTQGLSSLFIVGGFIGFLCMPNSNALWQQYLGQTSTWVHFVGMVFVLHGLIYWGMVFFFALVEESQKPNWIYRYKIQTKTHRRPPAKKVAWVLFCNQLLWTPAILWGIWFVLQQRGWSAYTELPSIFQFVMDLTLMGALSAIYFYVSHRFLHRPWWMKNVHKVHHEYRTSSAIAAEYAHWVEFVFGNFGTLAIGVVLLAPDLITIYAFTILGTITFVGHHSGRSMLTNLPV